MGDISMWKRRIVLIAIIGLLTLVAFQVISAEQTTDRTKAFAPNPQRLNQMLDRFEEAGIDVSDVRETIAAGKEVTNEQLQILFNEAKEKGILPLREKGEREFKLDTEKLNEMLDRFEEAGIDVSEIRKAIEEGKEVTPEMLKSLRDQSREKIPDKNLQDRARPNQKYTKEK
jgi:hypothetical protein